MSSEFESSKPKCTQVFTMLCTGLEYVNSYVENLKTVLMIPYHNREDHYIKQNLMPVIDDAKNNFDAMMKASEEQLDEINIALERTVSNHKTLHDDMKNIKAEASTISVELECKKTAVEHAKENLNRKQEELSDSNEDLRNAEIKLQEAQEARATADVVAIALAFIPILGVVAAPITLIIAYTALEDNITNAGHRTEMANREVCLCKSALQEVMLSEQEVEEELSQLYSRKTCTAQKLENLNESIKKLHQEQKQMIEVNEEIKNCHKALCSFHGKFKVLLVETSGGYSLSLLRDTTQPVVESVRALLQSVSVKALCDGSTLADINYHYKQINQVTLAAVQNESEDEDHINSI